MYGPGLTFQQDNARPHTAKLTRQHLQQHNVTVMNWPSRSPDLSLIGHIWDELKRNVRKNHNPQSLRELRQAVQREWDNLLQQTVQRYVNSMRNHCFSSSKGEWRAYSILNSQIYVKLMRETQRSDIENFDLKSEAHMNFGLHVILL